MKRVQTWLLAIGWIGAFVFPIVGIIVGVDIGLAKTTTDDGTKAYTYDHWSRKQSIPMVIIAFAIVIIGIVLQARRRS